MLHRARLLKLLGSDHLTWVLRAGIHVIVVLAADVIGHCTAGVCSSAQVDGLSEPVHEGLGTGRLLFDLSSLILVLLLLLLMHDIWLWDKLLRKRHGFRDLGCRPGVRIIKVTLLTILVIIIIVEVVLIVFIVRLIHKILVGVIRNQFLRRSSMLIIVLRTFICSHLSRLRIILVHGHV